MKRVLAAVGVLTLMSVGAANAALAGYDFENATVGNKSLADGVPFSNGLTALGITSSTVTASAGVTGVWANGGNLPNASFGNQSFTIGDQGTWELVFGGLGVSSFSFDYNETEPDTFEVKVYDLSGTVQLGSTIVAAQGVNNIAISGLGPIGRITITDVINPQNGGDNVQIDNLLADTITGVPEPSTYFMIGSALAGLAAFRRRRA